MSDQQVYAQPLLSVRDASKRYSGVPALIDAHLALEAGEVHALMGENGAGKSTLIRLLAGVVAADTMQVEVQGRRVHIGSPQDAARLGLRFIHQELNIVPQLSVAENIFLNQPYPTYGGVFVAWGRLRQRADDVLQRLGVTHIDPRSPMSRLSPGDQMLVSIARAFAGEQAARIYVMDEPTAALSASEVRLLFDVIGRLKAAGSAILYVSHRMEEIFRLADRVTVLRDGRVVGTHAISAVTPRDLIALMTGRMVEQIYPPRTQPVGTDIVLAAERAATRRVRAVTFTLRRGEIIGVAGLNGSGRTELLRALVGADRVRSGRVLLDGAPLPPLTPAGAWRRGIAYVPEERRSQGLVMSRAVEDNMLMAHLPQFSHAGAFLRHGMSRAKGEQMGAAVRLRAASTRQIVRQLSGGNQQKVVFARALVEAPRVLLLDEPTRGVDVGAKADLYALIRQISDEGTGIVMVSSDLPELIGMTDRIVIMRGGVMVEMVETDGLTEAALLALCYGEQAGEDGLRREA